MPRIGIPGIGLGAGSSAKAPQKDLISAAPGPFFLSGVNAGLIKGSVIVSSTVSFALSGIAAGLKKSSVLPAGSASFALTGKNMAPTKASTLAAGSAALVLTGKAVTFTDTAFTLGSTPGTFLWLSPKLNTTYGTTLKQTSGSTATLTTTGAQTVWAPLGLRVVCSTAGALGVSKVDIFYDDSASAIATGVTTSVAIALTGAGSGLVLVCGVGTMAIGNQWRITATSAANAITPTDTFTASSSSTEPIYGVDTIGPYWLFDGVDDTWLNTTIDRGSPSVGSPTRFLWVGETASSASFKTFISANTTTAGRIEVSTVSTGPNLSIANNTTRTLSAYTTNTGKRVKVLLTNSTSSYSQVGGVGSKVNASAGEGAFDPPAGLSIASRGGAATTFNSFKLRELTGNNTEPSGGDQTSEDSYVSATYGAGYLT